MTRPPAEQLEALKRGVVDLVEEEELLARLRAGRPLRVKLGVDPTAPDLHLGHTVVLRKLRQFQDLGHQGVLIIGDATARVGDPSGRQKTRPMLSREEVEANLRTWLAQIGKVVDVRRLEIVRNSTWFDRMALPEVLRLAARMTVARMLERNDFQARFQAGTPIGLHEFFYPLMQGWDSVMVRADVELGGTDQLFNLHVGRDLQAAEGQAPQVLMTLPIIEGTDGRLKMSKTYGNAIALADPPDEMFGKLMSIPDTLLRKYFLYFTSLPEPEIEALLAGHPRDAKERLAREVVAWLHGPEAAAQAAARFNRIFRERELPEDMPEVTVPPAAQDPEQRVWVVQLVRLAGFAPSNAEARRLVSQGAVRLDGTPFRDPEGQVAVKDGMVLRVGRRRFARLRLGRKESPA